MSCCANRRGVGLSHPEHGRFVNVVLTLDHVGTTTSLAGTNHLDIAVSNTSDPTGAWTIYRLPVQNNGTQGTPDHHCNLGFCLGDYPHIGADANGFYITTNEFSFFGSGFYGVNIYALDKHALASHASSVNAVLLFQNVDDVPAFTVWPAQSPGTQFNTSNGGTEFLLSSLALFTDDGTSNQLVVWSIRLAVIERQYRRSRHAYVRHPAQVQPEVRRHAAAQLPCRHDDELFLGDRGRGVALQQSAIDPRQQ